MNRIKLSPLASASLGSDPDSSAERKPGSHASLLSEGLAPPVDSSFFVPLHYESGYRYPLVVWLHDEGDNMGQLSRVMAAMSLRNYVGVAPRGPRGDATRGYSWPQERSQLERAHEAVDSAVDQAQTRFSIHPERIFIGGFGSAGTMALRIAFERADLFRAVISLNGQLPQTQTPLAEWQGCRGLDIFWAHFRDSLTFSESTLCRQLRLLHIAGFSVTLRQYPGEEVLSDRVLSDVDRWMMQMIASAVH